MTHMNPATHTPPVGCPLLIRLPSGRLVRVERRQWAASHSEPLEFYGDGIGYWADMSGHTLEGGNIKRYGASSKNN